MLWPPLPTLPNAQPTSAEAVPTPREHVAPCQHVAPAPLPEITPAVAPPRGDSLARFAGCRTGSKTIAPLAGDAELTEPAIHRRLVTETTAAEIIGLPLSAFRHWVEVGRLPGPLLDSGLYDQRAIDAALDRLSGIGSKA